MENLAPTTAPKTTVVRVGMHTPWGWADSASVVADGIGRVSTPGHGGFKLAPKMNAKVDAAWRTRGGWYEEDCEWAIVVLTFPKHFDEAKVASAKAVAKATFPDAYETVTGETVTLAESHVLRKREFAKETANKLVVICAYGDWHKAVPAGMVGVVATVGGKRETGTPETKLLVPASEYHLRAEFGFVIEDASKYATFNL